MNPSRSTQDTESSAVSASTEIELDTAAAVGDGVTAKRSSGVYAMGRKVSWGSLRNFLLRKSCALYTLVVAIVWLLHAIPIIVFLSIDATVSICC